MSRDLSRSRIIFQVRQLNYIYICFGCHNSNCPPPNCRTIISLIKVSWICEPPRLHSSRTFSSSQIERSKIYVNQSVLCFASFQTDERNMIFTLFQATDRPRCVVPLLQDMHVRKHVPMNGEKSDMWDFFSLSNKPEIGTLKLPRPFISLELKFSATFKFSAINHRWLKNSTGFCVRQKIWWNVSSYELMVRSYENLIWNRGRSDC